MKIVAVDPGSKISGYALFNDGQLRTSGSVSSKADDKTARSEEVMKKLFLNILHLKPDKVVCEYPIKSGPGWKSKNIVVLFHFCGMLHGLLMHHNIPVEFIEVSTWKGQIPKDKHHKILIPRFKKKYGVDLSKEPSDVVDAVGIGDWWVNQKKKP